MTGVETVFLADDDEDFALLFRIALEQVGAPVRLVQVSDAAQAVAYLSRARSSEGASEGTPCLLIIDLHLPGMNGIELLRWVRHESRFRSTPVVIFTGSADASRKADALREGASEFLVKPFEFEHLGSVAEAMCRKWLGSTLVSSATKAP